MKRPFNIFFARAFVLIIGFLLQITLIILGILLFYDYFAHLLLFSLLVPFITVLFVVDGEMNPAYKIAWIIAIMCIPILGWLLYYTFRDNKITKLEKNILKEKTNKLSTYSQQRPEVYEEILSQDKSIANQINYFNNYAYACAYKNSSTKYYSIGEFLFEDMIKELKKAEKFIFIEFFIIGHGKMWAEILEILKMKALEGVDVRVMYDDLGSFFTLPKNYNKELESYGIQCYAFNPLRFAFTVRYNNRNHSKILVIDGKTAFTGGINIADEYINEVVRFGHWKDTGIMVKGDAVFGFTTIFLSMWEYIKKSDEDYNLYKADSFGDEYEDGFVVPFMDNPLETEIVGENVYMNIIQNAKEYVYINTPYLILDNEMLTCLCSAAKRGVDVRITTPHIPDKKVVFQITRANYAPLVNNGVKIYEYTPGFMHAKSFVSDDLVAVIGTINLDYRSLYLHFENALWMYKTKTVLDMKEDYLETLEKCTHITKDDIALISKHKRIYNSVLKIIAPFM